jgi:CMP-N,N'-diacetyllegionaminic acid synthase
VDCKILAIIPARGGSKSIPNKNIKFLGKKPLIAYPIDLAKSIKEINKIIVSTDSQKIADIAKSFGAEVPFIRPKNLAKDDTPTLPVLQHAVQFCENELNFKPDIILLLYPTCPFLKKETIIKAITLLKQNHINSVVSVSKDYGRFWVYDKTIEKYVPLYPKERINRQYYLPLYKENGAIYFSKYNTLMNKNKLVDEKIDFIVMNEDELIDIDTPRDWLNAERILNKNENKNN